MPSPISSTPRRTAANSVAARKGLAPSKIVVAGENGVKISHTISIRQPARPLYAFWRDVENIAHLINHPVTISAPSEIESHWALDMPADEDRVEWDALIINDEPDKLIAWRSSDNSEVASAGTVRFEASGSGTAVTVTLEYNPPETGGDTARAGQIADEVDAQVAEALRRFRDLMEEGL